MSNFEYKAKSGPQKIVSGVITADDDQQAVEKLLKSGLTPLEVKLQTIISLDESPDLEKLSKKSIKVPLTTVAIFTRQMSDMIDAGVPLLRCLEVIMSQKQSPPMLIVIQSLHASIKGGGSLSSALAQHPRTFSLLYVNMVKAAELGGYLPQVLARMADFIEKDIQMRGQVKSSLLYPVIIFGVGLLTMFILLTFVLPRLTVMFEDFDTALPLPTQIVVAVSGFFSQFWWLIIIVTGGLVYYFQRWLSTPEGRLNFDNFIFGIPILREYIQEVEMARFARTMGTLLESGVTISSALESVVAVVDNFIFKEEIQAVVQKVKEGSSLTAAIKKSSFFSETAINLISIGEESGKLEKGLYKLAQINERTIAETSQRFLTILGPAVLVVVVSFVGFVVIAMLLPMFRMNMIVN